MNWKRTRVWIQNTIENQETNSLTSEKLPTDEGKPAVENTWVEQHGTFGRHKMYIGILRVIMTMERNLHQKMKELWATKTYQLQSTWKNTHRWLGSNAQNWGKKENSHSSSAQASKSRKQSERETKSTCVASENQPLIRTDYPNISHPVSNLSDTAQYVSGNTFFLWTWLLLSIPLFADSGSAVAFDTASWKFAYVRLAQRLNKSISAFSTIQRDHLEPHVKAKHGA